MATIRLPPDFREFLQLPNENGVEYTMSDRYAVGHTNTNIQPEL